MRKSFLWIALVFGVLLGQAEAKDKGESTTPSWEKRLLNDLPALGHRNWIVIADSAYPAQVSPGMEIVVSNEDHFVVLEKVLAAMGKSRHLHPKVWLDKELEFVPNELAPGMDDCRKRLKATLAKYEVKSLLHEEHIARLDQVARTFRILMIKTNLTLPYTTVFLEVDCSYWRPDAEAKMREKMK